MKRNQIALTMLAAWAMFGSLGAQENETQFPVSGAAVIEGCRVEPARDLEISAGEPGLLTKLNVQEGDRIDEGHELGHVDDREAIMQQKVVFYQLRQAKNRAEDKIDELYSRAAAEVAEKEVESKKLANQRHESAFTEVEVQRAELDATRAGLAIQKAINDRKLAEDDYWVKKAEYEATEMAIERRKIIAPNTGEVVKLFRREGEWVNPGEPVLQLVQLDTLHVYGNLDIEKYEPRDVLGCEVTVELLVGGGRRDQAKGVITWVSPIIYNDGRWVREVRADIANEFQGRFWRYYPGGVDAKMTIQLGTREIKVSRRE